MDLIYFVFNHCTALSIGLYRIIDRAVSTCWCFLGKGLSL